ncbi:MAG: hypothetical protein WCP28_10935, partial [Actinomycetes bacterium]
MMGTHDDSADSGGIHESQAVIGLAVALALFAVGLVATRTSAGIGSAIMLLGACMFLIGIVLVMRRYESRRDQGDGEPRRRTTAESAVEDSTFDLSKRLGLVGGGTAEAGPTVPAQTRRGNAGSTPYGEPIPKHEFWLAETPDAGGGDLIRAADFGTFVGRHDAVPQLKPWQEPEPDTVAGHETLG